MLGKLIKHEFKSTARMFAALYGVVLVITLILKGIVEVQTVFKVDNTVLNMITVVTIIAFVLGIIAIFLGSFVLVIKRFYDNMLKDEGYLSFTLPVRMGEHIAGKSIVGFAWMVISAVVAVLLVTILGLGHNEILNSVKEGIELCIKEMQEFGYTGYVVELIFVLLLSCYSAIVMGYACFSIGQTLGKNKVLGAFVAYLIIYFIMQIISSVAMVAIFGSNLDALNNADMGDAFFQPLMTFSLVLSIIQIVVYIAITNFMLKRKLNLQ